jgi:hypothetical protein
MGLSGKNKENDFYITDIQYSMDGQEKQGKFAFI